MWPSLWPGRVRCEPSPVLRVPVWGNPGGTTGNNTCVTYFCAIKRVSCVGTNYKALTLNQFHSFPHSWMSPPSLLLTAPCPMAASPFPCPMAVSPFPKPPPTATGPPKPRPTSLSWCVGQWPDVTYVLCRAQWLRGRASDSQLREPRFESCAAMLKPRASFFTLHCSSALSCINEYLAIDSDGYVYKQPLRINYGIWLDASQRSWDGVWFNRLAWEVKDPILRYIRTYLYTLLCPPPIGTMCYCCTTLISVRQFAIITSYIVASNFNRASIFTEYLF